MQSNTPTPYQRNRRSGRIDALPDEKPVPVLPTPQPARPDVPLQPSRPPAVQPSVMREQRETPAPQRAPSVPRAYSQGLSPTHGQARAVQSAPPRTARPAASAPLQERTAAGSSASYESMRRTNAPASQPVPRTSRAEVPSRRYAEEPGETSTQKPSVPSWLWTLLCLSLIGVMALVAANFVMMAWLKTNADQKLAAHEAILYNYHLTEQQDGTMRVTWQEPIERYAALYNLDPAFVTAVIRNESSFRTDAVSSAGARGLMQMMPDTAEWVAGKLDENYDFDRLFDAETSIRYGCWYLSYLSQLFQGDPVLVSAAYHAGQGEVWGWLGNPGISPDGVRVPIENIPIKNTKTYAGRVTQAYGIYETLLYPDASASDALRSADSAAPFSLSAAAR